jgi:hypothetical protein
MKLQVYYIKKVKEARKVPIGPTAKAAGAKDIEIMNAERECETTVDASDIDDVHFTGAGMRMTTCCVDNAVMRSAEDVDAVIKILLGLRENMACKTREDVLINDCKKNGKQ